MKNAKVKQTKPAIDESRIKNPSAETFAAWKEFKSECITELQSKNSLLETEFKFSQIWECNYDLTDKSLVFSDDGTPVLVAECELVGTVSLLTDTWLWSWANALIPENSKARIKAVAEMGRERGFPPLVSQKWPADESDGWEMAAVAARVLNAKGVYRYPLEKMILFFAIISIRKAD